MYTLLNNTIEQELLSHILDMVNDGVVTNDNIEDLHYHCFNGDNYIVYHSEAKKWLDKHNIDTFDAIDYVIDYEKDNFGEVNTDINPESIVNMLVYILGEEVIYNTLDIRPDETTVEELKELIKEQLD